MAGEQHVWAIDVHNFVSPPAQGPTGKYHSLDGYSPAAKSLWRKMRRVDWETNYAREHPESVLARRLANRRAVPGSERCCKCKCETGKL